MLQYTVSKIQWSYKGGVIFLLGFNIHHLGLLFCYYLYSLSDIHTKVMSYSVIVTGLPLYVYVAKKGFCDSFVLNRNVVCCVLKDVLVYSYLWSNCNAIVHYLSSKLLDFDLLKTIEWRVSNTFVIIYDCHSIISILS